VTNRPQTRAPRRALLAVATAVLLVGTVPLAATAAPPSGFITSQPSMVLPGAQAPTGTTITPLMTVGDMLGAYRFEAIPDGIAPKKAGKAGAQLYVNHETSTVPFPYNAAPTVANSSNDYLNSQLSKLMLRQNKAGEYRIADAEMVIDSWEGYHRFCSNYLASTDGFENRQMVFANEEGIDWVYETVDGSGLGWTTGVNLEDAPGARQIGAVVAYDLNTQTTKPIWGMGRHNHENSVAIPGYGYPVLLSGDDAFNQVAPQSQLYSYIADDADDVWNDGGDLWAFVSDDPDITDYYDFQFDGTLSDGGTDPISGHFVKVPKDVATGKDEFGVDMTADDFDYPEPPSDGTWQRPPGATSGAGIDGPQWVLEHWGDSQVNPVFQFLRIEDIAFDRRPGYENYVYLVDSGRGTAGDPAYGRSTNGRVWQMVLDPEDPTVVESLSVLIEGDNSPVKTLGEIHQPDNIESTLNGLLITEDPGSSQQFTAAQQAADPTNATTARLMYYDFDTDTVTAVLKVDQSADEGPTDEDTSSTAGSWGAWEASGIVDVSSIFGADTFLINVQAHTLFVDIDSTSAPDNLGYPNGPDWLFKREGGQLLLVKLPGV
jgi:hypothetical protein